MVTVLVAAAAEAMFLAASRRPKNKLLTPLMLSLMRGLVHSLGMGQQVRVLAVLVVLLLPEIPQAHSLCEKLEPSQSTRLSS